jgi:hypothetical protein
VTRPWPLVGSSLPRRGLAGLAIATATALVLVALPAIDARGEAAKGDSPHRADASCATCHTGDADALRQDPEGARAALIPDLEAACDSCHADEGPSHPTGMAPRTEVPSSLPLAPDGTIACATCHFLHGEPAEGEAFARVDNSRGGLCLTCHSRAELE